MDPLFYIGTFIIIFVSLGIHEYAHAKMADLSGDPTPRIYGRVTLNIFKHLDPVGTMMIVFTVLSGFGIGWGKPVPVDPRKMRNPRWDHFWSVAAGPVSNLIQAAFYAMILRIALGNISQVIASVLLIGIQVNLALCFFNLIPLGPLDGHWMLGSFMKEPQRTMWYRWNAQMGGMVLLGLILLGQISPQFNLVHSVLRPPVEITTKFLLGIKQND